MFVANQFITSLDQMCSKIHSRQFSWCLQFVDGAQVFGRSIGAYYLMSAWNTALYQEEERTKEKKRKEKTTGGMADFGLLISNFLLRFCVCIDLLFATVKKLLKFLLQKKKIVEIPAETEPEVYEPERRDRVGRKKSEKGAGAPFSPCITIYLYHKISL